MASVLIFKVESMTVDVKSGVIVQSLGISWALLRSLDPSGAGFERHGVGVDPVESSGRSVINMVIIFIQMYSMSL